MSRPRYYWFNFMQKCLKRYPEQLNADPSPQSTLVAGAIARALTETAEKPDGTGAERLRFIDMVYFKKTHSFEGAALALNISPTTAQRWNSSFIYLVAERAGYLSPQQRQKK